MEYMILLPFLLLGVCIIGAVIYAAYRVTVCRYAPEEDLHFDALGDEYEH